MRKVERKILVNCDVKQLFIYAADSYSQPNRFNLFSLSKIANSVEHYKCLNKESLAMSNKQSQTKDINQIGILSLAASY